MFDLYPVYVGCKLLYMFDLYSVYVAVKDSLVSWRDMLKDLPMKRSQDTLNDLFPDTTTLKTVKYDKLTYNPSSTLPGIAF